MSTAKLFVGNIPFSATAEALESYFGQAGDVIEVALMYDKITGRSRGFGFVTMGDAQGASRAIEELNGQEFEGRSLTVNEARPREPRADGNKSGFHRPRSQAN